MDLKPLNTPVRSSGSFIVFRSVGSSYFSSRLVLALGLQHGDYVQVAEDQERKGDYYLYKADSGYLVKKYTSNKKSSFNFHARTLARDLGFVFGLDHKCIKIKVAPSVNYNGTMVFPMITEQWKLS